MLAITTIISGESWMPHTNTGWWWVILLAAGPQIMGQGLIIWAVARDIAKGASTDIPENWGAPCY